MPDPNFIERHLGQSLDAFVQQTPEQRAPAVRAAVPDLHFFFDEGAAFDRRDAPARTRGLATSLYEALARVQGAAEGSARTLRERIVTDAVLRGEADRDQNVYFGPLFTRRLTRAVPDLIFLPETMLEAAAALRWGRERGVPVTLRGAASTAMGGAVPNDGGLTIDLSRLDSIEIDEHAKVCVVGAGARLRTIHAKLAARELALHAYPSNLGGTLGGWFLTGGIGLNAFSRGRALDTVRAADVLLPAGEHVRFHDDGRLDVIEGHTHRTIAGHEATGWFRQHGYEPMTLVDLAGSEGAFGILLHLTVRIGPRPELGAFLLGFDRAADALDAVDWLARLGLPERPVNVKFLSASHLHHTRRVWEDEDAKTWRAQPGVWSSDAALPWRSIASPESLGARTSAAGDQTSAYLFVDFADLPSARLFAQAVGSCPGAPRTLGPESARFAAERFKPQQTKRLGPGMIAAEIVMPAAEVRRFLPAAERIARQAGNELDAEVYFLADGAALFIGGYLTDHRTAAVAVDLMIAPALLDHAMANHLGKPYVLGRWQAAYLDHKVGRGAAARIRATKRALDPAWIVNRGVLVGTRFHGPLGALVGATFVPGVSLIRAVYEHKALAWIARAARSALRGMPGPAHGRGTPAAIGATFRASAAAALPHGNGSGAVARAAKPGAPSESMLLAIAPSIAAAPGAGAVGQPEDRAVHCVNCGECNSVCPVFHESGIRLPQMLTHLGEGMRGARAIGATGSALLDLCMRCGNCEQVCQAGIPHLPLYERMQEASNRERPHDRARHLAVLSAIRASTSYQREFLGVRPGGYLKRTPVALPGVARFVVLRSENDAGPAATCIHCSACVPVCPTHANREFEGADPRWITTVQDRCIGCGACVEVCPNNHLNGGQTLRVMEAPTPDWFAALESFELQEQR